MTFEIKRFRDFLFRNCVSNLSRSKITVAEMVDALAQFNSNSAELVGKTSQSFGNTCRILFGNLLKEKPRNVAVNIYLLYLYGFLRCYKCGHIIETSMFYNEIKSWHGKSKKCKQCADCQRAVQVNADIAAYKQMKKESARKQRQKNPNVREHESLKQYNRRKRIPKWLTAEDKDTIRQLYSECLAKGSEYQVDHTVPLQGKYVSGLHVPWNLNIVLKSENLKKNNYHESEEGWK